MTITLGIVVIIQGEVVPSTNPNICLSTVGSRSLVLGYFRTIDSQSG